MEVLLPPDSATAGELVRVCIDEVDGDGVRAHRVELPPPVRSVPRTGFITNSTRTA